MFVLILSALLGCAISEPSDVIVQLLYKPKDCTDIGRYGDTMHVQYLGRFYESREIFDSSYRRNNVPFQYVLGVSGVIEGYQIGTKDMCINERRRLIVPSKYAYGAQGTANIPGYSTLMFDVHLVQINSLPPRYPVPIDLPTEVTATKGEQNCENTIKIGDIVEIQYVGSLPDGKVFDNGTTPLSFVVGTKQVLAGIDEGIVSFCKGSMIMLEIPPTKAYSDRWEGPVPQWSYVYYNVTVTKHIVHSKIDDGDADLHCDDLSVPLDCELQYKVNPGDYVDLSYKVLNQEKSQLGGGEMRYPVGRKVLVPGWDQAIQGSCVGHHKLCWIPSSLAHKMGTSLFLAPPEKGFFTELKVSSILLTFDDKDSVDLLAEANENVVKHSDSPTRSSITLTTDNMAHSEL